MKCIYPCSKKKTFPKCLICHILKTDIWEVFKLKLDNTIKIDRLQAPLVMLKWFLHNIYTIRKKTLPTKLITNPHVNPRQPKETHFAKKPFSKNSWVTERHSWSSCRVINPETDDPKCHQSQCQSLFVISRHWHTHIRRGREYIFRGWTLCAMSTFVHLLSRPGRRTAMGGFGMRRRRIRLVAHKL